MVSTIEQLDEFRRVVFKHLGIVRKGVENLNSDKVKKWHDALEKYFLEQIHGKTRLRVEVDTAKEYWEMTENGFKRALRWLNSLPKLSQMK